MKNLQVRAEPLPLLLDLMKHLHNKKQQNENVILWLYTAILSFLESAQGIEGPISIYFFIYAAYMQTDWIIEKRECGNNFEVAD